MSRTIRRKNGSPYSGPFYYTLDDYLLVNGELVWVVADPKTKLGRKVAYKYHEDKSNWRNVGPLKEASKHLDRALSKHQLTKVYKADDYEDVYVPAGNEKLLKKLIWNYL